MAAAVAHDAAWEFKTLSIASECVYGRLVGEACMTLDGLKDSVIAGECVYGRPNYRRDVANAAEECVSDR